MRKLFNTLLVIFIIALGGILFINPFFSPCDRPFKYHVGSVDPRFNITTQEFLTDTIQASNIWSNAEGKSLIEYDPKAEFSVNLIYDERQRLNSQVTNLNNQVTNEKNTIDPKIAEYEAKSNDFKTRLAALNSEINYWNNKGGAPSSVYDKLIQEQSDLNREAQDLNALAKSLNQQTQAYNTQINLLNNTINVYDQTVQAKPEEGLYQPQQNKIDIYYNNGHTELVHTIAHEFGHALGLSHLPNPNAIMYYQTNMQITASEDDIKALQNICQRRSAYEILSERITYLIQLYSASYSKNKGN